MPPPAPGPILPYQVVFAGNIDSEISSALSSASQSQQLESRPPASLLLLQRRAADDVPRLVAALHSLGYYNGEVSYKVENPQPPQPAPASGAEQALSAVTSLATGPATKLVFTAVPGPRYKLADITIELTGDTGGFKAPSAKALGLVKGGPAVAQTVLDGEQKLLDDAKKAGHALAELGKREVTVNHVTKAMDVTLRLTPGPVARYGEITFEGAPNVDPRFLRRSVTIRPDSKYNPDELASDRQSLVNTQLFSTVQVDTAKQLDADGRLPVTFKLVERKPRTHRRQRRLPDRPGAEHHALLGASQPLRRGREAAHRARPLEGRAEPERHLHQAGLPLAQPDPARQRLAEPRAHRRL